MLSNQCLYSFDIKWLGRTEVPPPNTNKILSNVFQKLKGSVPIELELSLQEYTIYSIRAVTIPRMDKTLCVDSYLNKNTVHGQSRWPYNRCVFNSQLFHCNEIIMDKDYRINDEFLSLSPPIVPWHQVTSLSIAHPFNSTHLRRLFSQAINLRTLELHYRREIEYTCDSKRENLIHLFNDASLCNMLMSNGLRQLNLFFAIHQSNLVKIAYLITERLPHLQVIKLDGLSDHLIEMSHMFINRLEKLNFLTITGGIEDGKIYENALRRIHSKRIISKKLYFYDLHGEMTKIKVVANERYYDNIKEFNHVNERIHRGDIIGVKGRSSRPLKGELSIIPSEIIILTASLHQLPHSHYRFKDKETRYRELYLDLMINHDV
ncbi:unnamed protein product, partial [Rotaria sp. Silwood2]